MNSPLSGEPLSVSYVKQHTSCVLICMSMCTCYSFQWKALPTFTLCVMVVARGVHWNWDPAKPNKKLCERAATYEACGT